MREQVNNSVCEHRQKIGETQEAFANAIGVSRQTIIALEKGNYAPSIALALRIAKHLNVSVEDLFYLDV